MSFKDGSDTASVASGVGSDAGSAILKDIQDAFQTKEHKYKTRSELILAQKKREIKEDRERKRMEKMGLGN
jgi:hypothetical protein